MNICFINPSQIMKPEVYDVARNLSNEHNITIMQPCSGLDSNKRYSIKDNILVECIPSVFLNFLDSKITLSLINEWMNKIGKLITNNECDLIHVCNYTYISALPPVLLKRKFNVPILITNDALLGMDDYSFGSTVIDNLTRAYSLTLGKKVLNQYDAISLLYSKLAKVAIDIGLPSEKVITIPNGIDVPEMILIKRNLNSFSIRAKYGVKDNEKVVLFVGRLVKIKRVDIILHVIKKLTKRGINVKALIVGDGPQKRFLEKISRDMNLNIKFTGYLSKEKFECYNIADVFLLPSLSEGLPNVLLEAASFGIPIVATNTNGIPDIVLHDKTGFLVKKEKTIDYFNFIENLLLDESMAKEYGKNGKKHIENNFSWQGIVNRYEDLYEKLHTSHVM